jgi:hypothetical protein
MTTITITIPESVDSVKMKYLLKTYRSILKLLKKQKQETYKMSNISHKEDEKFPSIDYRDCIITYNCIDIFKNKKRSKNDINNKKRENIIGCIINNKVPDKYYKYSSSWRKLKNSIDLYIEKLCKIKNIDNIDNIVCIHKAGRTHHYDFELIINNNEKFMIEFKFNASSVNNTPQFVSPMNPSQYLDFSYEEYYYDNYLDTVVNTYNLPLPTKEDYLKDINSPKPKCLQKCQEKYYRGCKQSSKYSGDEDDIKFYKHSKKISGDSIKSFIEKYDLKKDKLTEYLLKTQKDKYYMLYKDDSIYLEEIDLEQYIITETTKEPKFNRYLAKTKTGKQMKILLRWKNGNGIAYPSFQIS